MEIRKIEEEIRLCCCISFLNISNMISFDSFSIKSQFLRQFFNKNTVLRYLTFEILCWNLFLKYFNRYNGIIPYHWINITSCLARWNFLLFYFIIRFIGQKKFILNVLFSFSCTCFYFRIVSNVTMYNHCGNYGKAWNKKRRIEEIQQCI